MALFDELFAVIFAAMFLTLIGSLNHPVWSFLFAFLFTWPVASLIARRFAGGHKTMGSGGRYARGFQVYLFLMVGIVAASFIGSNISDAIVGAVGSGDITTLFFLSLLASALVWSLMRSGLY